MQINYSRLISAPNIAATSIKLLILLNILILPPYIKEIRAEDDFQNWTAVTFAGSWKEDSRWRWFTEFQPRLANNARYPDRLFIRPAIGYLIGKNLVAWLGYGWAPSFMDSEFNNRFRDEHRAWQQLTYDQFPKIFEINHRLRMEQIFIDGSEGTAQRLRYLFRFKYPFRYESKQSQFGLSTYMEYFYNLNSLTDYYKSGYDRIRIFTGPYWHYKNIKLETGYLIENREQENSSDRQTHAWWTLLGFNY